MLVELTSRIRINSEYIEAIVHYPNGRDNNTREVWDIIMSIGSVYPAFKDISKELFDKQPNQLL